MPNLKPPPAVTRMRFLVRAGYGALALAVVSLLAHLTWGASGTNEWKLVREEDGVKIWTLKSPGVYLNRVKASVTVRSTLGGMTRLLEDLESCVDAYCHDAYRLETIPSVQGRAAAYVHFKFDFPGLRTREYVLFSEHAQDPVTKRLEINVLAAPNMLPRDPCCLRVTHLNNQWRLTPRPGSQVDIEFTQDTDLGGLPYPLTNLALVQGMFKVMREMQALMDTVIATCNSPRSRN